MDVRFLADSSGAQSHRQLLRGPVPDVWVSSNCLAFLYFRRRFNLKRFYRDSPRARAELSHYLSRIYASDIVQNAHDFIH
jgi:hypothetical protein